MDNDDAAKMGNDDAAIKVLIDLTSLPLDIAVGAAFVASPTAGGLACFVGTTRGMTSSGIGVDRLEFEAHIPLARAELKRAVSAAQKAAKGVLVSVYIAHRLGSVSVGEAAVICWVSAPHRAEALEGVKFIIDALKARAPIWKKEVLVNGDASWRANSECC